jgi:uncharacterized protein (DUF302 family)
MSDNGLMTIASRFSVRETIDRLTAAVTSAGLLVFARIDHASNAAQVGMELRPTELLIFGHPGAAHHSCKTSRLLVLTFRLRLLPGRMKRVLCG